MPLLTRQVEARELDNKRKELERSAVEEMQQEQTEIDAGIAKLRAGLADVERRLNPERRPKAS